MTLPQSTVYEIILDTVYKRTHSLKIPKGCRKKLSYFFFMPLTHLQYLTIPYPMRDGKENYYPLTLFLATVWIWFYTYIIVWFTYQVTKAIDLHFSIVPMIIYPFGIALRDQKKFKDLRMALK